MSDLGEYVRSYYLWIDFILRLASKIMIDFLLFFKYGKDGVKRKKDRGSAGWGRNRKGTESGEKSRKTELNNLSTG